jgi:Zn-dependent protease/CBS domain-containing protein
MTGSIKLGKFAGIPIRLHYTWFIIFVLVTLSLARLFFPGEYPGWGTAVYWTLGVVTSLLFFASVVVHEVSHSLVARRFGVPVRDITLFLFGGVASITREVTQPIQELLMAVAGPLSSTVLAGMFALISIAVQSLSEPVAAGAMYLARINLLLGLFNMLPGFPLDGGRVFRSIVWAITGQFERSTRIAARLGQAFAYLFIIVGVFLALSGSLGDGIWLAFIGWFMDNAASSSFRQVRLKESLRGYTAEDLMRTQCTSVPMGVSLETLVDTRVLPEGQRCFLVTDGEDLKGLVTLHEIRRVPKDRWPATRVEQAMTKVDSLQAVGPDEDAYSVLERMDGKDVNQIPVLKDGHLIGIIARDSILRFIRTKSELGI